MVKLITTIVFSGFNDAFTFITSPNFSAQGQLKFADGILSGNIDFDFSRPEFEIALTGVTTINQTSDLIL